MPKVNFLKRWKGVCKIMPSIILPGFHYKVILPGIILPACHYKVILPLTLCQRWILPTCILITAMCLAERLNQPIFMPGLLCRTTFCQCLRPRNHSSTNIVGDINLPICKARNFGWRHFPKIESQEFGQESFLHLKLPFWSDRHDLTRSICQCTFG